MHAVGKTADPFVQIVDLLIAIDQAALQIKDADNPGKVDALAGKLVDKGQAIDIRLRVHAGIAAGALGRNQALLLVCSKGLRVHACQFGSYAVKVPAGAVDGGRLRFRGKGAPGESGGEAGDLLVTTRIQDHPYFKRDGADVLIDVPVNVAEAALGASVVVPAPDGTKVRVKVPAGTQDQTVMSVRGKGAPKVKGSGNGDLKITVKVQVPKSMNPQQQKAMEAFLEASPDDVRSW